MGFLGGRKGDKWGKGWCDVDPNELVFTFGGFYVCANFCENRSTERVPTDGYTLHIIYTHGHTQTGFVICHMLYAIAMGQIINEIHKI